MTFQDIVQKIKKIKKVLKKTYHINRIGIFGSYKRGEQTSDSDVDILIELDQPIGFFKFLEAEEYLSQELSLKVDLVTKDALKPDIGIRILQEVYFIQ